MKVVATKQGFYDGSLRAVGEKFDVADGAKASWFVPVAAYKAALEKAKKPEPNTLSALGKEKPRSFNESVTKSELA